MTYDFEIYSIGQSKWLEVSSVSTFDSFQAERLKLRYRNSKGKKELLHTLNGSSLALPRIIAGILENFQDANGINLPKVLVPYTGFEKNLINEDLYYIKAIHNLSIQKLIKEKIISFGLMPSIKVLFN